MTLLLKNDEIIPLIDMRDSLNILEQAYRDYGTGKILNVPWSLFHVPAGKPDHFYRLFELRASMSEVGISALRVISTVIQAAGLGAAVGLAGGAVGGAAAGAHASERSRRARKTRDP